MGTQEGARCAELEARFRDPATPTPVLPLRLGHPPHRRPRGRPAASARLPRECDRFAGGPSGVRTDLWARWARSHYMACALAPDWKRKV
jgi:hypothetical protein